MLDVSRRLIVIVGGGSVAARKAQSLLEAGASRVRVVAPEFDALMPGGIERVPEMYHRAHLSNADLVFAATDHGETNSRIVHDARTIGILVCRVDDDEEQPGDFVSPAVHRDGPVMVAVSAGSAALSASIRDGIASRFDARWARMADAMRLLRPKIRDDAHLSAARRRAIFRDLSTEDALAAATAGPDAVWKWLVLRHPDLMRH